MSQKKIVLANIGEVLLQRRKGTRTMRLSIRPDGTIRVGMPAWMPYKRAVAFIESQQDWLAKHGGDSTPSVLIPEMLVGKNHRLLFQESMSAHRTTTRLSTTEARVIHPVGMIYKDPVVQQAAERVSVRALTQQANEALPTRLKALAEQHSFTYRSVTIKRLQTRWGSCSNHQDIVLNCFLMQLPWGLIDYVLLHELLHTRIMRHGPPFWSALSQYVDDLPAKRKAMKAHMPHLFVPNE